MALTRIVLEGKCDRARYPLRRTPDGPIIRVSFRSIDGVPFGVQQAQAEKFYLPVTKEDGPAQTEEGAYWFTRAVYERYKRAVWYYFDKTNMLIVFPPPEDGMAILVYWEDQRYEESSQPLFTPKIGQ